MGTVTTMLLLSLLVVSSSGAVLQCEHSPKLDSGVYAEALRKSYWFYQANRAGQAGPDVQHWRKPCFTGDSPAGGWFDAGDHVKFTFTIAYSAVTLAWGVLEFPGGYNAANALRLAVDELEFAADYLMLTNGQSGTQQVVQVADGGADHSVWAACWNYDNTKRSRPVTRGQYKDVLSETSSALTSVGLVMEAYGSTSAQKAKGASYKARAVQLYEAGKAAGRNTYGNGGFYGSDSYKDEQAWAAMWLYKANPTQTNYLNEAKGFYPGVGWGTLSWNNKGPAVAEMLCQAGVTQGCNDIQGMLEGWRTCSGVSCTGAKMPILDQWGAFRYAANTALLGFIHSQFTGVMQYGEYAATIISYILGDNPRGSSYVIGIGPNPVKRPHHRSADDSNAGSCQNRDPTHTLFGAMVGGATGDTGYPDNTCDYVTAEVAIDYNAGYTGAVAAMNQCGDNNVDDCAGKDCGHGKCVDKGWVAVCECTAPWGGASCSEKDTDDCGPKPCKNGGECQEGFRSYTCRCPPGYVGKDCEEVAPACPVEGSVDSDCRSNPDCCPTTHPICYEKNQWWAGCRPSCSAGEVDSYDHHPWSCKVLGRRDGASPAPPPTTLPPPPPPSCPKILSENEGCKSNPGCCAPGTKCYRKNQWWAGCLKSCQPGWVDSYDHHAWECSTVTHAYAAEEGEQTGATTQGVSTGATVVIGVLTGLGGVAIGALVVFLVMMKKRSSGGLPATHKGGGGLRDEELIGEADQADYANESL